MRCILRIKSEFWLFVFWGVLEAMLVGIGMTLGEQVVYRLQALLETKFGKKPKRRRKKKPPPT